MLSLHVKGWVVLSHAKGWVVIAHVKGWVVIAHVKGWVVLPNAKGRVVLRTTLSLTWDDNPPPPDLPWCIRYYLSWPFNGFVKCIAKNDLLQTKSFWFY